MPYFLKVVWEKMAVLAELGAFRTAPNWPSLEPTIFAKFLSAYRWNCTMLFSPAVLVSVLFKKSFEMEACSDKTSALITHYALISIWSFFLFIYPELPRFFENLNPNVQAEAEDGNCNLNNVSSWVFFIILFLWSWNFCRRAELLHSQLLTSWISA